VAANTRAVTAKVRLEGYALHAGVTTAVTLARHEGPLTFARDGHSAPLASMRIARTDFGVTLTDDRGLEIDLVEHLLAAFGGLGIRSGVLASVEGPELPLLDGGARLFANALLRLEAETQPPRVVVERPGCVAWERSSYEFAVADGTEVSVETIFDHPLLGRQRATFGGDPRQFFDEIAPARTFGFVEQASDLWLRGRARLAAQRPPDNGTVPAALDGAVLIFDATGIVGGQKNGQDKDEVARHKLLDLIGDLALSGGPPRGRIFARRPGHTATHRILREALSLGILSRR
jgi:UDP-3-O-[3-hydroxymyristoyl] N-acetylglucosamine deacetylase